MTHFHRWGLAAILTAMMTVSAQAHFIWVVTESADGTHLAKIYFGEDAAPDDPALLSHIKEAKAHSLGGWRSEPATLPLEQQDDALVAKIPEKNSHQPVIVSHQFGKHIRQPCQAPGMRSMTKSCCRWKWCLTSKASS